MFEYPCRFCTTILLSGLLFSGIAPLWADGGITFENIAADSASGLAFQHVPSADIARVDLFRLLSLEAPLSLQEVVLMPTTAYGLPGVAVFDYDRDSDLDLFVTNGLGAPHSLYQNLLSETGTAVFLERAAAAGVDAPDMDGQGVCAGDLDNDGDPDLVVLSRSSPNRVFENHGDGTFSTVGQSGLDDSGDLVSHNACSLGDLDGDGFLDVVVANSFDMETLLPIRVIPYAFNQHNQVYRGHGDLTFTDVSASSGIEDLALLPPGAATITWAIALVDIDLDGDVDVIGADDQAGVEEPRGFLHVMLNDGSGNLTDRPIPAIGGWMGLGFGDLDCDGAMDIFASNLGDYDALINIPGSGLGAWATRAFFGRGDATFDDPGMGQPMAFGWGNAVFDYDNDGDSDLVFQGGLDNDIRMLVDNPGVLLRNRGCVFPPGSPPGDRGAGFTVDLPALGDGARHLRRNVRGVAIGDLDRDGFVDIVSVSNFNIPESLPLVPTAVPPSYGSVLDVFASVLPLFHPAGGGLVWNGFDVAPGDLSVELSSGDNGNGSVTVHPVGSVGLTAGAAVNRGGIGAVVFFTPTGGQRVMMPITAGSSHVSTHATEGYFGLGAAGEGVVEVLWPGGVKNRVYDVRAGEYLVVPEIPCSFAGVFRNQGEYVSCVARALADLAGAGVIAPEEVPRFLQSAITAFAEP